MHLYKVGELYAPTRTSWPEGVEYNYRSGAHELRLFFPGVKPTEIEAIRIGPVRFALFVERGIIFLLFRFAGMPWSEAPYSWHMVPADQQTIPPDTAPNERVILTTFLVSGDTGKLLVIRLTTLAPEFTRILHQAIRDQVAQPFDQRTYDRNLAAMRAKYPDVRAMVDQALVRCNGGDDETPKVYEI
jgi:hypothetical protein